jgi:hypothetical protein
MADIFLSYESEDRERVMPLIHALGKTGWSVFWDRTIPTGKTWRGVISREIRSCRCIVVVWSKTSVESEWVGEEAEEGRRRQILFPVSIDDVLPPFGFGLIQAADLTNWEGTTPHQEFDKFISDIAELLGSPPVAVEEEKRKAQEEERERAREEAERRAEQEAANRQADAERQPKKAEERRLAKERGRKAQGKREEILAEPEIAQFLETHQGAAKQIKYAIELLADEPDAKAAVKKLLPALDQNVVFVFFSYNYRDERAAEVVVNVLRKYSAGKLRIAYQADFAKKITGRKWRENILTEVRRANWFILLLPDPSDDWDWCLYEAGLFDRPATSADRLICLHHPDIQIPDPIKDYHAVPANISDVENFLQMVYVHDHPVPGMEPINRNIEQQTLRAMAKEIVNAIPAPRKAVVHRIFEPWMQLKVENAAELLNEDDLDDALIVSADKQTLHLFGYSVQPETWGELRSGVTESAEVPHWRYELCDAIRRIAQGRKFDPIQAVFHTNDGKTYRPVVYAIDRLGLSESAAIETYHIIFTEELGAVDTMARS